MSSDPFRPTVDDVALVIRARTKDQSSNEVGTFDDATRPTALQVEEHIDAAFALVGLYVSTDAAGPDLAAGYARVVALEAACQIEKSYWPEQVNSDRSAYTELNQELQAALRGLVDSAAAGAGDAVVVLAGSMVSVPVESWTLAARGECPPAP